MARIPLVVAKLAEPEEQRREAMNSNLNILDTVGFALGAKL
jgi:hypothetical protein